MKIISLATMVWKLIHSGCLCFAGKKHYAEKNPVVTNEALVVSSFLRVSVNKMPRSAPGNRVMLSHSMAREHNPSKHVLHSRKSPGEAGKLVIEN